MMRNNYKLAIMFFLVLYGVFFVMIYKSRFDYQNLAINGRIETIEYDTLRRFGKAKDIHYTTATIPHIKVNNIKFILLPNLSFKENVQMGDSIIKHKSEKNITVIKRHKHESIVIKF
jgi:hypothetical protein